MEVVFLPPEGEGIPVERVAEELVRTIWQEEATRGRP